MQQELDKQPRFTIPEDVLDVTSLGGGLEMISERKLPFTHDLANRVIGLKTMPGDRPLRPSHVSYLINTMQRCTFRPEFVMLISCELDGEEWRMNGQHTCLARLELSDTLNVGQVRVVKYRAKTFEDMRMLYSTIDRGAPRTKANVVISYLSGTEEFGHLSDRIIKLLAEGFGFWMWEDFNIRSQHDGDDVAYLMKTEYIKQVLRVGAFCSESPSVITVGHLRRGPVVAAMLETFSKSEAASLDFWRAVRDGTGMPTVGDPRLKLRNALMQASLSSKKERGRKQVNGEEVFRWCIHAWNAWRRGEPLHNLRAVLNSPRPKAIRESRKVAESDN